MERSLRTFIKIILLFVVICGLVGCDTDLQRQKTESTPIPEQKFKIATLVKVDGIPWFARMRVGVEKFARETGQDSFMIGPAKADGALQAQMVDELIKQGVNAICIVPFSAAAVEPALQRAKQKGIVSRGSGSRQP